MIKINHKLLAISIALLSFSLNGMVQPKRALKNSGFKAAGILAFTRLSDGQDYAPLLSEKHGRDAGTYDALGGKRDQGEKHPAQTASREFVEETLGLLGSPQVIIKAIDPKQGNTKNILTRDSKNYVLYLTEFPAYNLQLFTKAFYNVMANVPEARRRSEKDAIRWVKWSDLKEAMEQAHPRKPVWVSGAKVDKATGGIMLGNLGIPITEQIQIRPILAATLRPYFQNETFETGKNQKIRFYQ